LCEVAAPLLPQLHTLQLRDTGLGDEGASAIAAAAEHWPRITLLGSGSNMLTEQGLVGLTAVLERGWWAGLLQLDLQGNNFMNIGSQELQQLRAAAELHCKGGVDTIFM
jgi:Ran GTPase-activating protein (RanGAP) involved in mRNA processing and transport